MMAGSAVRAVWNCRRDTSSDLSPGLACSCMNTLRSMRRRFRRWDTSTTGVLGDMDDAPAPTGGMLTGGRVPGAAPTPPLLVVVLGTGALAEGRNPVNAAGGTDGAEIGMGVNAKEAGGGGGAPAPTPPPLPLRTRVLMGAIAFSSTSSRYLHR